jgi:two-component sensor histidine kinase
MQGPIQPANERQRLEKLAGYQILDTPPEAAFDDLVAMVAHIMDVPIALISLVDAERQWFKSHHGLDASETPREVSFCGHVVASGSELVVADSHKDPRFADNPLVTGPPHVRFYAGAPLLTADGFVLGTLCAIDHDPREVTPEQRGLLSILARQVVGQLELRKRNLELLDQQKSADELQETLRASLREKDVLLHEVHHRVKNNLQLVASLINLQRATVESADARNALEECQGRIHAIANVHEAIYSARDYARVPIAQYARGLAASIFHATGAAQRRIELELDLGDFKLAVGKAIPCGLILNELISNAFKHAFPGDRTGCVRVQVEALSEAELRLVVSDDGVGLPAGFSLNSCTSVGMQVVAALVEQLDAKLELTSVEGTRFAMTFRAEG